MMSTPMPTFPLELFTIIIDKVDVQTLISCRAVCKMFCDLIDHSPVFQYKIELAVAGMDDGPPSDRGPIERLRMLKAHQTAWNQLSWNEIHISARCPSLFTCSGSVLARGYNENPDFLVTLTQLPSVLRGIEEKTWTLAIRGIRSVCCFEIDPSQDLIVLMNIVYYTDDGNTYRRVHLHMLSTGEPHPLSAGVLTHREPFLSPSGHSYWTKIMDNMVGVRCSRTGYLTIWDWKTGELKMEMRREAFSFLTKDLVITSAATGLALDIYDLRRPLSEEGTPTKIPLLCTFQFPPFRSSKTLQILENIFTDLSSGKMSQFALNVPFHISQSDRLYAIRFRDEDRQPPMLLVFASLSTFMAHINGLRAGEIGRSFSWVEWGEKDAHILEYHRYLLEGIHGMKFLVSNGNQLEVYDFNHLSFRRGVWSNTAHPRPISILMHPACTSVSYQVRSAPMPDIMLPTAVIMTEDGLIYLNGFASDFPILSF